MMRRFLCISGAWLLSFAFCALCAAAVPSGDSVKVSTEELADRIVAEALKYKGTPYSYGSRGPKYFDCSGFTSYVYRKFGYELSRSSGGQAGDGRPVEGSLSNLQKGDIVVFGARRSSGRVGHVGIFIEMDKSGHDFTFIHAATKGGVIVSHLKEPYYLSRFMGARRIIPDFVAHSVDGTDDYRFDVENGRMDGKDALVLAEGDARILLSADGQWVYVNADGTLSAPSDSVKLILEPSGRWQSIKMSTHRIPSLAGAPGTASAARNSAASTQVSAAGKPGSGQENPQSSDLKDSTDQETYHTIRSGDTLYALAKRYGTTVPAICRLNNISASSTLKVGRRIRVK